MWSTRKRKRYQAARLHHKFAEFKRKYPGWIKKKHILVLVCFVIRWVPDEYYSKRRSIYYIADRPSRSGLICGNMVILKVDFNRGVLKPEHCSNPFLPRGN